MTRRDPLISRNSLLVSLDIPFKTHHTIISIPISIPSHTPRTKTTNLVFCFHPNHPRTMNKSRPSPELEPCSSDVESMFIYCSYGESKQVPAYLVCAIAVATLFFVIALVLVRTLRVARMFGRMLTALLAFDLLRSVNVWVFVFGETAKCLDLKKYWLKKDEFEPYLGSFWWFSASCHTTILIFLAAVSSHELRTKVQVKPRYVVVPIMLISIINVATAVAGPVYVHHAKCLYQGSVFSYPTYRENAEAYYTISYEIQKTLFEYIPLVCLLVLSCVMIYQLSQAAQKNYIIREVSRKSTRTRNAELHRQLRHTFQCHIMLPMCISALLCQGFSVSFLIVSMMALEDMDIVMQLGVVYSVVVTVSMFVNAGTVIVAAAYKGCRRRKKG